MSYDLRISGGPNVASLIHNFGGAGRFKSPRSNETGLLQKNDDSNGKSYEVSPRPPINDPTHRLPPTHVTKKISARSSELSESMQRVELPIRATPITAESNSSATKVKKIAPPLPQRPPKQIDPELEETSKSEEETALNESTQRIELPIRAIPIAVQGSSSTTKARKKGPVPPIRPPKRTDSEPKEISKSEEETARESSKTYTITSEDKEILTTLTREALEKPYELGGASEMLIRSYSFLSTPIQERILEILEALGKNLSYKSDVLKTRLQEGTPTKCLQTKALLMQQFNAIEPLVKDETITLEDFKTLSSELLDGNKQKSSKVKIKEFVERITSYNMRVLQCMRSAYLFLPMIKGKSYAAERLLKEDNALIDFVTLSILSAPSQEVAALRITFFVKVLQKLKKYKPLIQRGKTIGKRKGDYNAYYMLILGLTRPAVTRTKAYKELLSINERTYLEENIECTSLGKKLAAYTQKAKTKSAIPNYTLYSKEFVINKDLPSLTLHQLIKIFYSISKGWETCSAVGRASEKIDPQPSLFSLPELTGERNDYFYELSDALT